VLRTEQTALDNTVWVLLLGETRNMFSEIYFYKSIVATGAPHGRTQRR
jgi:hypothetical protein